MTLGAECDKLEPMRQKAPVRWCVAQELGRYQRTYERLLAKGNVAIPPSLGTRLPRSPVRALHVVRELQEEIRRRVARPATTIWDRVLPPLVALLPPRMLLIALHAALILLLPLLRALPGLDRLLLSLLERLERLGLPEPAKVRHETERAPPQPPPLVIFPTIQINAPNGL